MGQIVDNAIAWVQFQVVGGVKKCVAVAIAYAMIVVAICGVVVMVNPTRSGMLDGAPSVLLGIQGIIVAGITAFRITSTIQRDTTSKLLESHRLMPIDPRLAVLGYAAGGGLAVVPLAIVNLFLGAILTANTSLPMTWWFWANGVLLSWSIFAWCIAAGGAMLGPGMGAFILAPLVLAFMSAGAVTLAVPGMAPMLSPLVGKTIFSAQTVGSEELVQWVICMALQLPVACVIVLAGARRFRCGDIPGLTGALGSALVLLFALSSIAAVLDPQFIPRHLGRSPANETPTIGTLIALMVLGAAVAMAHVARHAVEFPGRFRGASLWVRDAGVVSAVAGGAVAFLTAVPNLPRDWPTRTVWSVGQLVIVISAMLLWARCLVRWGSAVGLCLAVVGIWWVLPLFAGTLVDVNTLWQETPAGRAMLVSPLAMLSSIWGADGNHAQLPSLLLQLLVPGLAAALLLRPATPAEPLAVPSVASVADSPAPVDSHRL